MPVAGVICEFDPFHLGHARLLRELRAELGAETAVVCLMSGNYVQRGAPALFDKYARARAAVSCGADLVLELPLTRAVSSAEGFAGGGVEILDRLGIVDALCFGSESGDLRALKEVAAALRGAEYEAALRRLLREGRSFAACRQEAVRTLCGADADRLSDPNDNLGVEYCKALLKRESKIRPLAIRRPGAYHEETPDPENPSATAVRALFARGGDWRAYVPPEAAAVFQTAAAHTMAAGERAVLARLRTLPEDFELPFGAEGLSNRFRSACREEASVEAVCAAVKSKRYALARIRRMVLCAYLGLSASDLEQPPPYVRALAFDGTGRVLLRKAKRSGEIPVVNAGESPPDPGYYALERRAADLYALFSEGEPPCRAEERGRVYYRRD